MLKYIKKIVCVFDTSVKIQHRAKKFLHEIKKRRSKIYLTRIYVRKRTLSKVTKCVSRY